jgi:hypothetical protein
MNHSIIILVDDLNRLNLFKKTFLTYLENNTNKKNLIEFIFLTRNEKLLLEISKIYENYIEKYDNNKNIEFTKIKYIFNNIFSFNPALALNLGVKNSKYNNIIITCPEVYLIRNIFSYIEKNGRNNYVFEVIDENQDGTDKLSLVCSGYRDLSPAMYFLACYKKEDIEKINGWDLKFMNGYAHEDVDFGERFVRANLEFKIIDGKWGRHQWHVRGNANSFWYINYNILNENNKNKVIVCENGLLQS